MSNLALTEAKQLSANLPQIMEKVLIAGDLSKMEAKDRITYYLKTCESLGMNYLTKPFDLITLNGKMVLYPNRSGTDQLRKIGSVDTKIISKSFDKETGCFTVVAQATLPNGRTDEDMGVVYCAGMKGDALANAQLKAMTKAKRRVTLSIMGLGWVDESEVDSIRGAKKHKMDLDTGNVIDVGPAQTDQNNHQTESQNTKKIDPEREAIYRELMPMHKLFRETFPEVKFSELLFKKYGVEETKLMTLQELQNLLVYLQAELALKSEEITKNFPPISSSELMKRGMNAAISAMEETQVVSEETSISEPKMTWFKEPKPGIDSKSPTQDEKYVK